ncbi:MAG: response regulator [Algicola sp.]|nr:response regulator [Algicola sp.]
MQHNFAQNTKILIVEDQPLAQNYLKYALENLGFGGIVFAERAKEAIEHCSRVKFDLVLCSFDLSKGKDGYQLYEELKERKLIRLTTGFIFISAETEPGLVHSVLELQPDDFLVKPFTLKDLDLRISRVLNRKNRFKDIYRALDRDNVSKALDLLDSYLSDKKYAKSIPQLLRIKGELLLQLEEFVRGQRFFISVLKIQKLTWAKIGLIKCLIALGQEDRAFAQLEVLATQPATQLEALELLGQIQFKRNDYNDALKSIKKATKLSPRNITRQDKLVNIARINHDYESQYKACRDIVKYAKNSLHENPDMYLNVVRSGIDYALTNYNEEQTYRTLKQANEYISELKTTFPNANKEEQINVINARILYLKDEKDKAKLLIGALDKADEPIVSVEDELDKAKSFHELGFYSQSKHLFEKIDQHCQQQMEDNNGISAYIKQEKQQREEIKEGPKQLNNNAVSFYQRGNYAEAFKAFRQAFALIPGNISIALNLLQSISNTLHMDLADPDIQILIGQCLECIEKGTLDKDQVERFKLVKEKLKVSEETS